MKKMFDIKGLLRRPAARDGAMVGAPNDGATVELSARAGSGSVDG
jgi:hypothetical protein